MRLHDRKFDLLCIFLVLLQSIRLHVPVSASVCMIVYLIETTYIYICALLCFYYAEFYVLIIMSISVKRHEL